MFERHTTWVQSGCKLCQHNGESGGLFEKEGGLKGVPFSDWVRGYRVDGDKGRRGKGG